MYDYMEAVKNDVLDYIRENWDEEDLAAWSRDDMEEKLNDTLFTEDSVTGNGSGSYWCNAYKARECLLEDDNVEDYIRNLIDEFGLDSQTIADNFMSWEYWDVSIRCYLLGECISDALDELEIE